MSFQLYLVTHYVLLLWKQKQIKVYYYYTLNFLFLSSMMFSKVFNGFRA